MSKTQNQSYKEIKTSSRAQTLRDEILRYIELNPGLSRREIGDQLDILLNSTTARIKELIDEGLICERGTKKCPITGKEVALLWPGSKPKNEYDIESKKEVIKVFKLLQKIQRENQKRFEQTLRVINQHFAQKGNK